MFLLTCSPADSQSGVPDFVQASLQDSQQAFLTELVISCLSAIRQDGTHSCMLSGRIAIILAFL
ncbi:hypothetical protein AAH994_09495 [Weeksellaceae bacterium A-14]|uniref:hypothetical protein n=1 Tax=Olivibacter sp. XZL3 TaxID=1735116 RepID=UPI0010669933|nr:hypothetical protein [Olivibacter sp. XZL3]